jgi:uncharacterized ion transporter superfamily protein YfcC
MIAAALTWVLPAGRYDRRDDEATGRSVVVAGSYHAVEAEPVGPLQMVVALPRGMADAAEVIFFVFLVGGAFAVVERTGALTVAFDRLVHVLGHREALAIPICCLAFAAGGIFENMQEEIIALVPPLVLLSRRLGFDVLTAAAMSVGAAAVGSAFSPVNPFQVGIAQRIAEVPLLSGGVFRTAILVPALGLWIWGTMRYAARVRGRVPSGDSGALDAGSQPVATLPGAHTSLILALVVLAFAVFILGIATFGWGFNEMAAVFFVMGVAAGLLGRLRIEGTAEAFVEGFRAMAYAGILIGFARAIYIVLNDGLIIDTIVHGLFTPLASLPRTTAVLGMTAVQALIHVPVPSVSGQAVLTMPILVPLSDLLGLTRQVTILAYQYGAGLCELLTPTNGALMAILAAAGVRYEDWLRFTLPLWGLLMGLAAIALVGAMAAGLH